MSDSKVSDFRHHLRIVANGKELHRGICPALDPDELWHEAAMSACEMVREMFGRVEPGLDWLMEVSDQAGNVISRFSFKAEKLVQAASGSDKSALRTGRIT